MRFIKRDQQKFVSIPIIVLVLLLYYFNWGNYSFGMISGKVYSGQSNKPFSNPALIYGTSFGNFFQTLYKQGKYDDMIHFTSQKSIDKFGIKNIVDVYKTMEFGYSIKLKSKVHNRDKTITLNYETNKMATKGIMRILVVLENDTVKVILQSVKSKDPFSPLT